MTMARANGHDHNIHAGTRQEPRRSQRTSPAEMAGASPAPRSHFRPATAGALVALALIAGIASLVLAIARAPHCGDVRMVAISAAWLQGDCR